MNSMIFTTQGCSFSLAPSKKEKAADAANAKALLEQANNNARLQLDAMKQTDQMLAQAETINHG